MPRARGRNVLFSLLILAMGMGGCRSTKSPQPAALPEPAQQQAAFHVVFRANSSVHPVEVLVDGSRQFTSSGRAGEERFSIPVRPGWHELITRSADGRQHRAMIQGDRNKWIRIRGESGKTEGFRVHVTEYPIE